MYNLVHVTFLCFGVFDPSPLSLWINLFFSLSVSKGSSHYVRIRA